MIWPVLDNIEHYAVDRVHLGGQLRPGFSSCPEGGRRGVVSDARPTGMIVIAMMPLYRF